MADSSEIAAQPEPELAGRRLGDYELLRRLGRGGMAEVYLAHQRSLKRKVAFKVLKSALADDESYVKRFHNEAQAAAALVHANIVQIYEVGCIDGVHFIAQEYVAGKNLKQYLAQHGPISVKVAVNIMRQVAAALHKAGAEGIIHRDIKPENIMLAANGEVKVADFGLARVTGGNGQLDVTQVGVTMGTPLYMSPEQVEGEALDPRSDLYSFGVTCYQMLTGRPPFDGETALNVAVQHLKKEPDAMSVARPDLPEELCATVHKLLAKSPVDRFQSSQELLNQLRALPLEGVSGEWPTDLQAWDEASLPASAETQVAATQKLAVAMRVDSAPKPRTRTWIVAGLLVVCALAVGFVVALVNRPADLLHVSEDELPKVPRRADVASQYRTGYFYESAEAWEAVEEYFPPREASSAADRRLRLLYVRRSYQRLGEHHLREDDLERAMAYFTRLADLGRRRARVARERVGRTSVCLCAPQRS